jgi:hypothetical protein
MVSCTPGTYDKPYRPLTLDVTVTVYEVLAAKLVFGSTIIVLPSVCNEIVRATEGVNVTLVLLTVVGSIPILIVRLIVLLTGTPVAVSAGSEDSI